MKARLEEYYYKTVRPQLQKELNLKNIMEVPKVEKIVLNIGVKNPTIDSKGIAEVQDVLTRISGQKAVRTKAKKSVAGFKIRTGMDIGAMVTLRRRMMFFFLDKLINATLPAVRDFRGVSTTFDGHGNYNLGIKDWMVFPEIDYDKIERVYGLNITIHTSARTDEHAYALLKSLGMPFER